MIAGAFRRSVNEILEKEEGGGRGGAISSNHLLRIGSLDLTEKKVKKGKKKREKCSDFAGRQRKKNKKTGEAIAAYRLCLSFFSPSILFNLNEEEKGRRKKKKKEEGGKDRVCPVPSFLFPYH